MLNIEKYKDEILEELKKWSFNKALDEVYRKHTGDICSINEVILDWLCSEYKEPILDEEEKKYLSAVIEPFRDRIDWIEKVRSINTTECINITYDDTEYEIPFPQFEKGTMYKGMELNREYTLEELGL